MVMIQGLEMVRVMIQTSTSREDVGGRMVIVADEAVERRPRPPQPTETFRALVMLTGLPHSTTPRSGSYIHHSGYGTTVRECCVQ